MIPDIIKPYLEHPLVRKIDETDLVVLDNPDLNNIIRAEDQLIRSVREFYLNKSNRSRLSPGQFSSSIMNARGLAFSDIAHYKSNVSDICEDVWNITPTTAERTSFNRTMKSSIIRRLEECGIIEFDSEKQNVVNYMPYAVGSKLYVQKNLMENVTLFQEQANHYGIIGMVQDFPELTSKLEESALNPSKFQRDRQALTEIDAIRSQVIRGRNFTFSRSFLAGKKAETSWLQALEDEADNIRVAVKALMDLQGQYGGFISHEEIVKATGWNSRQVTRLMRHVDYLGISQATHTLEMKDALSRATSGTLLNMNYHELDNAQAILVLTREVPETVAILNMLQKNKEISEEDLMDEFDNIGVQIARNSLKKIGLITKDGLSEGNWRLAPFRGNDRFINDVLAVTAKSWHVLEPDYAITNCLAEPFKKVSESEFQIKNLEQMKLDFYEDIDDKYNR